MSDTKYSVVAAVKAKKNIAIIDDDWIGDSLSDDDIMVPKEFEVLVEDEEESDEVAMKEDAWNDLGLDSFLHENSSSSSTNINNFTAVAPSQPVASTLHQTQPTISQP
eukprot:gene22122-30356_t